jgi:hypothetical protein
MKTGKSRPARIYFRDGRVVEFRDQTLAYQTWLSLPRGTRAAFRGKGDQRPVYTWDYADKQRERKTEYGINHSLFIESAGQ